MLFIYIVEFIQNLMEQNKSSILWGGVGIRSLHLLLLLYNVLTSLYELTFQFVALHCIDYRYIGTLMQPHTLRCMAYAKRAYARGEQKKNIFGLSGLCLSFV